MKKLFTLIILTLIFQMTYGQSCGVYYIRYIGSIQSGDKEIVTIHLPTTAFLSDFENEDSERSFTDAKLINKRFNKIICSDLGTVYRETVQLLTLYRKKSNNFKVKVKYLEKGVLNEKFLEIDWEQIKVSMIKDKKFGILFKFDLGNINI